MNWLRLEKALGAWSAWYRPRLGRVVAGARILTPEEVRDAVQVVQYHLKEVAMTPFYLACVQLVSFATRANFLEFHSEEQALYEALDYKTENFRFTERVDALERLAIVAEEAAKGRIGGYWTEMHEILKELGVD